jgi:chorismate mutase/prephenate dehydratase
VTSLDKLRRELDSIDRVILEALARRRDVIEAVVRAKEKEGTLVRDPAREETLLADRADEGRKLGLDGQYVTRIFQEVLQQSLRVQQDYLARDHKSAKR